MSVIRAFIAIEIPPEIQDQLKQLTSQFKQQLSGVYVKWVPVENIHLTLKFLGNVSVSNVDVLNKILDSETSNHHTFEVSVGELGAFPSTRRPRVVWVKMQAPSDLFEIQRCIEQATARLGYATDKRSFKPHLTLGRVPRNANAEDVCRVGGVLESIKVGFLGAMRVKYVHLFRSELKPTGAVYTRIHTAELSPALGEY